MSKLREALLDRRLSLHFGVERQTWVAALVFVLLLTVFESVGVANGPSRFLSELYTDNDPLLLGIGTVYILGSLYLSFVLVLATLASGWLCRAIYLLVFGFAAFAEYGYSRALDRFTNYYDVVSAMSATSQQARDSVTAYLNWAALLPCAVLVLLCVFIKRPERPFRLRGLILVFAAIFVFYAHLYYVNTSLFDRRFSTNSIGSFFQTTTDLVILDPFASAGSQLRATVAAPVLEPDRRPANNIIFVFDESVRGDHLSLNGYSRSTTSYLESLAKQGLMQNWGIASSASTISHPSYNAMIVGATPEMLDKLDLSAINAMPTLFQYAKAMNYRTYMIDGQMKDYWGGVPDDKHYIDELITLNQLDSPDRIEDWEKQARGMPADGQNNGLKQWEIDPKIAAVVNQIFSGSTGNFVFVYKRGDHFPYEKNYPEPDAYWKPVFHFNQQFEIPPADQYQAVVNSYDNALRRNIDDFFRRLAPDYSNLPNSTVIIYTSDHGESFFVNGKAGHGGSTPEEATVPLFILGLKDRQVDTRFKASHANIFTTMLDLMEYPRALRKYDYGMSLFDGTAATQKPRFFNPPASMKVPFD